MAKPISSLFYLCLLAKATGTQLMCNHNYRFLKQINYGYIAIRIILARFSTHAWQRTWSTAARCFELILRQRAKSHCESPLLPDSRPNKNEMWGRGRTQDEVQKAAPHSESEFDLFVLSVWDSSRWLPFIDVHFKKPQSWLSDEASVSANVCGFIRAATSIRKEKQVKKPNN